MKSNEITNHGYHIESNKIINTEWNISSFYRYQLINKPLTLSKLQVQKYQQMEIIVYIIQQV